MIDAIFVDMDGVIVNFYRGALELFNIDVNIDLSDKTCEQLWNLGWMTISKDHFWLQVDKQGAAFWENLKPFPWTKMLWDSCKKLTDKTYILSKPSRHAMGSASGKHRWIKRHLGNDKDYIFTPHKHYCAAPNRILIDDRPETIDKWVSHGGIGILFKKFCEHGLNVNQTIEILKMISKYSCVWAIRKITIKEYNSLMFY